MKHKMGCVPFIRRQKATIFISTENGLCILMLERQSSTVVKMTDYKKNYLMLDAELLNSAQSIIYHRLVTHGGGRYVISSNYATSSRSLKMSGELYNGLFKSLHEMMAVINHRLNRDTKKPEWMQHLCKVMMSDADHFLESADVMKGVCKHF